MRLTRARLEFVKLFSTAPKPLSVTDVLCHFKKEGVVVNKTTVYRELERFGKLGLIRTVDLGDRRQYFERANDGHHHHFVCIECDQVEDIELDERMLTLQERALAEKKGVSILRHSLEFFGLCKMCH